MRQIIFCVACLFVGMAVGASIRLSSHYHAGYERGHAAAIAESHREAVREGHGHWECGRAGGPNRFVWNAVRSVEYAPDSVTRIPGLE
jgi:hypothetical protein